MKVTLSGSYHNCGPRVVMDKDFATADLETEDDIDHWGAQIYRANRDVLVLCSHGKWRNGRTQESNYDIDIELTRDEVANLARIVFGSEPFTKVIGELSRRKRAKHTPSSFHQLAAAAH